MPRSWRLLGAGPQHGVHRQRTTMRRRRPIRSRANGPFNNSRGVSCDSSGTREHPAIASTAAAGISIPTTGFCTNQRMFNIYDGPAYQDATRTWTSRRPIDLQALWRLHVRQGRAVPAAAAGARRHRPKECYMPNAAIGWKQPNGFYYPPAFHRTNLFFKDVDIRHYVIEPMFKANTYLTNTTKRRSGTARPAPICSTTGRRSTGRRS